MLISMQNLFQTAHNGEGHPYKLFKRKVLSSMKLHGRLMCEIRYLP